MSALKVKLDKEQREGLSKVIERGLRARKGVTEDDRVIAQEFLSVLRGHDEAEETREQMKEAPTDDKKEFLIVSQYNARDAQKLGMGERLEFWAAITRKKGEENLLIVGMNPNTGYIGSRFSFPPGLVPPLIAYANSRFGKKAGLPLEQLLSAIAKEIDEFYLGVKGDPGNLGVRKEQMKARVCELVERAVNGISG